MPDGSVISEIRFADDYNALLKRSDLKAFFDILNFSEPAFDSAATAQSIEDWWEDADEWERWWAHRSRRRERGASSAKAPPHPAVPRGEAMLAATNIASYLT